MLLKINPDNRTMKAEERMAYPEEQIKDINKVFHGYGSEWSKEDMESMLDDIQEILDRL